MRAAASLQVLSLMLLGVSALAQEAAPPPPTSTLQVNVQVVAVNALVRDAEKNLLHDLAKGDFLLRVDGKPVDIRYFNRDNDLPLTLGLMIDTSGSQRVFFDEEARASGVFLTEMLTDPKDRALVASFDARVELLQPMTGRLPDLRNGLRRLDYLDPQNARSTRLFDAIGAVSQAVRSGEAGRRALIVMTDGDDNGSRLKLQDAIRQAQLADVAVYGVLYTNDMIGNTRYPSAPGHVSGIDVMGEIARETGGRTFVVGNGTPIRRIYEMIAEDLRSQYRIGFTPPPSSPGKRHSVALSTIASKELHLTVQARTSYFTPE